MGKGKGRCKVPDYKAEDESDVPVIEPKSTSGDGYVDLKSSMVAQPPVADTPDALRPNRGSGTEARPPRLRGTFGTLTQLAMVIGILALIWYLMGGGEPYRKLKVEAFDHDEVLRTVVWPQGGHARGESARAHRLRGPALRRDGTGPRPPPPAHAAASGSPRKPRPSWRHSCS